MATTKITLLPVLTTPNANSENTVFVVVDKSSGTATTKQLSLQNLDLFVDNVGSVAFAHANGAFTQANSANSLAQAAFNQANTDNTFISITAGTHGNAIHVPVITVTANGRISAISNTAITGFANSTFATAAFTQANSANSLAQAAFNQANNDVTNITTSAGFYGDSISVVSIQLAANGRVVSASNTAITGFANTTFAASAFSHANGAYDQANNANSLAQAAFNAANTANAPFAQAAFDQANSANVLAQSAFDKANSANVLAQSAFNAANSANTFDYTTISTSAGVYGNATFVPVITLEANGRVSTITNTAITGFANTTFAASAFSHANGAYDQANNALISSQNAYDFANTITITLNDAFITASRNTANSAFGHANGAFTQANVALTTAALSFNAGNTAQTTASAGFNHANGAFDKANSANVIAQSSFNSANTNANTITVSFAHANAAFDKANSSNVLAQAAFNQANTSNTNATAAFDKANSANVIAQSSYDFANTVNTYAYSAYATANTISSVSVRTNSAFDTANTALTLAAQAISYDNQANAAYDAANSAVIVANQANTTANNLVVTVAASFDKANSANVLAQAAFNTANTKVSKSGDTMTGDLKFNGGGGILNLPTNQIAITANVDNDASGFIAQATGISTVYASTDVQIQANTGGATFSIWNFNTNGTITFPDSTIQTTAFTGDAAAGNVSANAVGYMGIPQNNLTSNYVITLADNGKHLYYNVSTNNIVYIPTTSNVAFPIGATIAIISTTSSSANVTITPNTGVSLFLAGNTTSAGRNVTTYGMATLIHVDANTWFVSGTGVSAL
jgi:hypothetical protein